MAEVHESALEEWWFNQQSIGLSLHDWLCIQKLKSCCTESHYGADCKPCPGMPETECSGNGKCKVSLLVMMAEFCYLNFIFLFLYVIIYYLYILNLITFRVREPVRAMGSVYVKKDILVSCATSVLLGSTFLTRMSRRSFAQNAISLAKMFALNLVQRVVLPAIRDG